jgi:monofunctional chorismate mutase
MEKLDLDSLRKEIDELDKNIAESFEKRMKVVNKIAEYKESLGLPTYDKKREDSMIEKNVNYINDEILKKYYIDLLHKLLEVSKLYQQELREEKNKKN